MVSFEFRIADSKNYSELMEEAVEMACSLNDSSINAGNSSNCTTEEEHGSIFSKLPEAYAVPVVFAIIFIVGVVGNGTLILTVLKNKNMRNAPNIFIVSLAFGDLLLILVSVPFTATIYTFTEWPYGETLCKLNEFLQALSLGVSVFTLTVLSADRYVAIVDPMKRHRTSSMADTLAIAGVVWLVSTGLAVLELVAAHIATPYKDIPVCELHPESWPKWYPKFHTVFRFVVYFAVPILTIGVFYTLMARILFLSSKIHGQVRQFYHYCLLNQLPFHPCKVINNDIKMLQVYNFSAWLPQLQDVFNCSL